MAEKKLSKKALNKSFRNWAYGNLTCFSQEHMQTFGYLCAMLPLVEELYDTKEEQKEAMNTYTAFFNTEPQVGSIIVGITAGLEEAKANGNEDIDAEAINGIRAGLMGPLAGIGVGSVAATWVSVKTSFHLVNSAGKEFLNLQKQLDGVYPGFLTAAFVIFCWWLMSKKKVSPVVTMLILVVVAFIGVMIGFFNPGLKY